MSRLCSIHHDIPVTMHTPAAYGQWSVFDHNGDNKLVVIGTRYGIWWPWYGQFEVGWLQPLQLWLGAGNSRWPQCWFHKIEISAMYSYIPLGLNQLLNVGVDQWFSYLYSGHLPVGLYLGRGSLLLVGPLFHFRQCHSWLDWVCLTTTHVLQDILAVLHRLMCLKSCFHSLKSCPIQVNLSQSCFHSLNNYSSLVILFMFGG